MIPQTVPKRPMKGVTLPVVARKPIIFSIRAISWLDGLVAGPGLRVSIALRGSARVAGPVLRQVGELLEAGLEERGLRAELVLCGPPR